MNLIWESFLDRKYRCEVNWIRDGLGVLTIKEGKRLLYEKEVKLAYNAVFGPDVGDVYDWQDMCIDFIDKNYRKKGLDND